MSGAGRVGKDVANAWVKSNDNLDAENNQHLSWKRKAGRSTKSEGERCAARKRRRCKRGSLPRAAPDFRMLASRGVPALLLKVILLLALNPAVPLTTTLDAAELFAGVSAITHGLRACGFSCVPVDITYCGDGMMDILTPEGFSLCISLILRMGMQGQGLLWLAPVCSTWIFMSMGSTGRSWFNPLGDTWKACVQEANVMNARAVLLCILAGALGVTWILEQPRTSVFHETPRFQWLAKTTQVWEADDVEMGAYGGSSKKSLKLFSNRKWVGRLRCRVPKGKRFTDTQLTKVYWDAKGNRRITGGAKLKQSQAYPELFGLHVAATYRQSMAADKEPVAATHMTMETAVRIVDLLSTYDQDSWHDANLEAILSYLEQ